MPQLTDFCETWATRGLAGIMGNKFPRPWTSSELTEAYALIRTAPSVAHERLTAPARFSLFPAIISQLLPKDDHLK